MDNREHFIATLQACYFGDRNAFNEIVRIYDDMEQRIDKAVEYIERRNFDNAEILVDMGSEYTYDYDFKDELLNILKGEDTNE